MTTKDSPTTFTYSITSPYKLSLIDIAFGIDGLSNIFPFIIAGMYHRKHNRLYFVSPERKGRYFWLLQ